MESRVRIELSQKGRFSDLWSSWAWKPVMVTISLMIFQQLSGINAALFNAVAIFESAGSDLDTLVSAVLLNVDQVSRLLSTCVTIILKNKYFILTLVGGDSDFVSAGRAARSPNLIPDIGDIHVYFNGGAGHVLLPQRANGYRYLFSRLVTVDVPDPLYRRFRHRRRPNALAHVWRNFARQSQSTGQFCGLVHQLVFGFHCHINFC